MRRTLASLIALVAMPFAFAAPAPGSASASQPAPAASRPAPAASSAADPAAVELPEVVVGVQPGPGLWTVEAPSGNRMLVLARVSPLPARMEWNSLAIERRIAESTLVLLPPRARVTAGDTWFGGVFLVPRAMRARNNPDGRTLRDVLPAADYERWQRLKAQWIGRDRGIEKRRPLVAGAELQERAVERSGLSFTDVVGPAVDRAARRHRVPVHRTGIEAEIPEARKLLREFQRTPLADVPCFRRILDQVENDLGTFAARANAWAVGDMATLQALAWTRTAEACGSLFTSGDLAERAGIADLPQRIEAAWLADAERALREHAQTFAVVSMAEATDADGWLARLAGRGYRVVPPADRADGGDGAETGGAPAHGPENADRAPGREAAGADAPVAGAPAPPGAG